MRHVLAMAASIAQTLLATSVALAADIRPSCELAKESVLSQSSSGLSQVSNLGGFKIKCRIAPRAFPTKPGESRNGLTASATAYLISDDGAKSPVLSEVQTEGGGFGQESEWVDLYVHIPLDPKEADAEARKYLAKLESSLSLEGRKQLRKDSQKPSTLEHLRKLVYQNRLGRFRVECHVLDGNRVIGTDTVEVEVVFKGRFSDAGLPAVPIA